MWSSWIYRWLPVWTDTTARPIGRGSANSELSPATKVMMEHIRKHIHKRGPLPHPGARLAAAAGGVSRRGCLCIARALALGDWDALGARQAALAIRPSDPAVPAFPSPAPPARVRVPR